MVIRMGIIEEIELVDSYWIVNPILWMSCQI